MSSQHPLVGLVMGSRSDWETLKFCAEALEDLKIPHEISIVSAHRTPDRLFEYAENAKDRQLELIIAGAGGAAHLPGMLASKTLLPVVAVPIPSTSLQGMDSLLSIVQMPAGIPVATMAIGKPGAVNAALYAAAVLGNHYSEILQALDARRRMQTETVLNNLDPRDE